MMSRKVPIIILFVDMEGEGVQNTLDWFTEVAKENIHRFSFLYAGYIPPRPHPPRVCCGRCVDPALNKLVESALTFSSPHTRTARTSTRAFPPWARAATSSRPSVTPHRLYDMPFSEGTAHLLRVVVRHNQWPSMLKLPRAGPSTSPRI